MEMITISRQAGSLGDEIAERLAEQLGWRLITRTTAMKDWLPSICSKHELRMLEESPKFYTTLSGKGMTFASFIEGRLREESQGENLVVVGLGGQIVFRDHPESIKVRIIASLKVRTERIMKLYGLNEEETEKFLVLSDRKHKRYLSTLYEMDWDNPELYDIILKTDDLDVDTCVEGIISLVDIQKRQWNKRRVEDLSPTNKAPGAKGKMNFYHPAEEEFAAILDMYNIEWEYEPRTFPIEWDAEGNVTKAFSPDFYLTRFNTFIELTTMDQRYVSEKKKKVKRVKELYPEININIVFKKDFHTLLKRFGRE